MPKVGSKGYSYSSTGQKAAKAASKRTGKKVMYGSPSSYGSHGSYSKKAAGRSARRHPGERKSR